MKRICLISCVKGKHQEAKPAYQLYDSTLFTAHLNWALKNDFKLEDIYILSAEHGLLKHDTIIEPYEKTLNDMVPRDKNKWAKRTYKDINNEFNIKETHFTILAGVNYYENLTPVLPNYTVPSSLIGLPIGKRVQQLHKEVKIINQKDKK